VKHLIRVFIADDHPIVREGLRLILEKAGDMALVGEAADGVTALEQIEQVQPDVVLMDLRMPGMEGLEAIRRIRRAWPQIGVLILTTYSEDELIIRGLRAGALGYLLKGSDLEVLLQAIRTAARGEALRQPEIMERVLAHAEHAFSPRSGPPQEQRSTLLTERERDILVGVAHGERSKEIAARLGLSDRTVHAYLTTIYNKLGVDSRAAAVAVAMERGMLPREPHEGASGKSK
jgi:NarL family two-component system response regulator YdfI